VHYKADVPGATQRTELSVGTTSALHLSVQKANALYDVKIAVLAIAYTTCGSEGEWAIYPLHHRAHLHGSNNANFFCRLQYSRLTIVLTVYKCAVIVFTMIYVFWNRRWCDGLRPGQSDPRNGSHEDDWTARKRSESTRLLHARRLLAKATFLFMFTSGLF